MLKVHLVCCPPNTSESEFTFTIEMPYPPSPGDYITVKRNYLDGAKDEDIGFEDFIVRRVRWYLEVNDPGYNHFSSGDEPVGKCYDISVECEFAISAFSSVNHREIAGDQAQKI